MVHVVRECSTSWRRQVVMEVDVERQTFVFGTEPWSLGFPFHEPCRLSVTGDGGLGVASVA